MIWCLFGLLTLILLLISPTNAKWVVWDIGLYYIKAQRLVVSMFNMLSRKQLKKKRKNLRFNMSIHQKSKDIHLRMKIFWCVYIYRTFVVLHVMLTGFRFHRLSYIQFKAIHVILTTFDENSYNFDVIVNFANLVLWINKFKFITKLYDFALKIVRLTN